MGDAEWRNIITIINIISFPINVIDKHDVRGGGGKLVGERAGIDGKIYRKRNDEKY